MQKLTWKDSTSYSSRDDVREPRVLETCLPIGRLVVHRYITSPGDWFVSLYNTPTERQHLYAKDLDGAKREGVKVVRQFAEMLLKSLPDPDE